MPAEQRAKFLGNIRVNPRASSASSTGCRAVIARGAQAAAPDRTIPAGRLAAEAADVVRPAGAARASG